VRRIWGDADLVLLVFAGAAAEFALNRAVDWLFVTGRLPRDPLTRLFSTAAYAQRIVFADRDEAVRALAQIRAAHEAVERRRGESIPAWAHRDVLYLLIDYSERAFRALHRPLGAAEQRELYDVFRRVGVALGIPGLPPDYARWRVDRERHLHRDLAWSEHTAVLYAAYCRDLGPWRYRLMREVQAVLVPGHVLGLLGLARRSPLARLLPLYAALARLGLRPLVHQVLVPPAHLAAVRRLDRPEGRASAPPTAVATAAARS
jgi:uncharacterized protein (DUF2236 family)